MAVLGVIPIAMEFFADLSSDVCSITLSANRGAIDVILSHSSKIL